MDIAKKIFSIVLNIFIVIIVLILIFAVYSFFEINIFNKKYVNVFGYTFFQVKTGSMENEIKVEDIVIDKLVSKDEKLNENEIISFVENDVLITHRIKKINDDGTLVTKGDANNSEDDPINRDKVIGKVVKIIPNVGIWTRVFKTKSVYISIGVTILLFVITFSIKVEDEKKESKSDNKAEETNDEGEEKK